MSQTSFYITTAIPYANGAPHIGHAYERVCTDMIARFKRLEGQDVLFVTGMDEYGLKMQQTAQKEGITSQELADRTAALFAQLGDSLQAPADDIVRTTQERHKEAAQAIWKRMADKGDIYLAHYSGWYSVRDEAYYDEAELKQDETGARIAPTGSPVEWVEEESYFFKLSAYADRLLAFYKEHPTFVAPQGYYNEIIAFVERGLSDLSISRTTFDWGVPVPDSHHVMYVWVDALTNYLTATGFPDLTDPRAHYWPAQAHVIGKDITRFHAIYWPAFLMSADLPLPGQILAHGFLFHRGEKMSKSVGNVVDPFELVEEYGVDAVRYFFLRDIPFGQDGNYSHEAIVQRINADLANDLGNLAQRSLSMIGKNCAGLMPARGAMQPQDEALLSKAYGTMDELRPLMDETALHLMVQKIWELVAETNRYFANEQPWVLRKTDPARMESVLNITAESLRVIGILIQPIMPLGAAKLLTLLAVSEHERIFAHAESDAYASVAGTPLPAPEAIFPRRERTLLPD